MLFRILRNCIMCRQHQRDFPNQMFSTSTLPSSCNSKSCLTRSISVFRVIEDSNGFVK